jgi:hypothetical protein
MNSRYESAKEIYASFGVDTENKIFDNIIQSGTSGGLDISALQAFTSTT